MEDIAVCKSCETSTLAQTEKKHLKVETSQGHSNTVQPGCNNSRGAETVVKCHPNALVLESNAIQVVITVVTIKNLQNPDFLAEVNQKEVEYQCNTASQSTYDQGHTILEKEPKDVTNMLPKDMSNSQDASLGRQLVTENIGPPRLHAANQTSKNKVPGKDDEVCEKSSKEGGSKTAIMSDCNVNNVVTQVVNSIALVIDLLGPEATTVVAKLGIGETSLPGTN